MLKKTMNKSGETCRVTFSMPSEVQAKKVYLCGEFNEWNQKSHPLKQRKKGGFSTTISLQTGKSYRYRYLLDGKQWENDWAADGYLPNEFGSEDSVVEL